MRACSTGTCGDFIDTLETIEKNRPLKEMLGHNGRRFFERHYAWPIVEQKYLDMLARLDEENREGRGHRPMPPLPGWLARRERTLPPAQDVVDSLPAGPALSRAVREAS